MNNKFTYRYNQGEMVELAYIAYEMGKNDAWKSDVSEEISKHLRDLNKQKAEKLEKYRENKKKHQIVR